MPRQWRCGDKFKYCYVIAIANNLSCGWATNILACCFFNYKYFSFLLNGPHIVFTEVILCKTKPSIGHLVSISYIFGATTYQLIIHAHTHIMYSCRVLFRRKAIGTPKYAIHKQIQYTYKLISVPKLIRWWKPTPSPIHTPPPKQMAPLEVQFIWLYNMMENRFSISCMHIWNIYWHIYLA